MSSSDLGLSKLPRMPHLYTSKKSMWRRTGHSFEGCQARRLYIGYLEFIQEAMFHWYFLTTDIFNEEYADHLKSEAHRLSVVWQNGPVRAPRQRAVAFTGRENLSPHAVAHTPPAEQPAPAALRVELRSVVRSGNKICWRNIRSSGKALLSCIFCIYVWFLVHLPCLAPVTSSFWVREGMGGRKK